MPTAPPSTNKSHHYFHVSTFVPPRAPRVLRNLAFSQLLLTTLILTTGHVQIITRVSSAYPVWVWYLATMLQDGKTKSAKGQVRFMVIYAVVQGGLFASFLPPA